MNKPENKSCKYIFGERLKQLRNERKLSQETLAKELGVSKGSLGFYETCKNTPDIEFLDTVSKYFDVSLDFLLGRTDVKSTNTDLKAVCEYTGLSEKAVTILSKYAISISENNDSFGRFIVGLSSGCVEIALKECNIPYELSRFIEDENFITLIKLASQYQHQQDNPNETLFLKYYIRDLFENIVHSLTDYPF